MPKIAAHSNARSTVNKTMRASSWAWARNGRPVGAMAINILNRSSASKTAGCGSCNRKEERLGQRLPHEPGATGAERGTHRQLSFPSEPAGGKQAGNIGAGDQQYCKTPRRRSTHAT